MTLEIEKLEALALAAPDIKTWQERMPEHVRWLGTAASEAPYKDLEIAELRAEVERLRAAIAGAEKDAERYRWIESKAKRDSRDGGWWGYYVLPMLDGWSHARGKDSFDYKTLSEAIDAAIEAHTTARKEPQ